MKYDAFISYRHSELDMEIAKKLHTALETYKVPAAVQKKTGKKKIQRVFRDQEELPIGSDLDDNISGALRESEYLVVICSPRTPESVWVCKEIETFIKMHDRHHVLAILIEGEPWESFPQQLLVDEEGKPVEPLAADIRGNDSKERNTKFKTEILRLLAPILGCTFDDLRQRHRERQVKKIITTVSAAAVVVALAGAGFGIYNASVAKKMTALAQEKAQLADEKTKLAEDVLLQLQGKLINQSKFLADESLSLFELGNREDAVLVALAGLPSDTEDRPYVPEAEYALSEALYAYDISEDTKMDRIIQFDYNIMKIARNIEAKKLAVLDSCNNVIIVDTDSWEECAKIDKTINERGTIEIIEDLYIDSDMLCRFGDTSFSAYTLSGELIYNLVTDRNYLSYKVDKNSNILILVQRDKVNAYELSTGNPLWEKAFDIDAYVFGKAVEYNAETGDLFVAYSCENGSTSKIAIFNKDRDDYKTINVTGRNSMRTTVTDNGNYVVLTANSDLYGNTEDILFYITIIDFNDYSIKKEIIVDSESFIPFNGEVLLKNRSYEYMGEKYNEIIVSVCSKIVVVDELAGKVQRTMNVNSIARDIFLGATSPFAYVCQYSGGIAMVNLVTGEIYDDYKIETGSGYIRQSNIGAGVIIVSHFLSNELIIYSSHAPEDKKVINENLSLAYNFEGSRYGDVFTYMNSEGNSYEIVFNDIEGKELLRVPIDNVGEGRFLDDKTYRYFNSDGIYNIDYLAGQYSLSKFEFDSRQTYISNFYVTENGKYEVSNYSNDITAIDLESGEIIAEVDGGDLTEKSVQDVIISEDGTKIYISYYKGGLMEYDVATDSMKNYGDPNLGRMIRVTGSKYITITNDGTKVATFCEDGGAKIIDVKDGKVLATIPVMSSDKSFIKFTPDGKYLVLQGDDYKIVIWDVEKNEVASTIDDGHEVKDIIVDEEDGMMAIVCVYTTILTSYENGCKIVNAPNSACYLPKSNSFIYNKAKEVSVVKYKNYKELALMAKKQFPNSSLSADKKTKYAIE